MIAPKISVKIVVTLTILAMVVLSLPLMNFSEAATITAIYDRLSRVKASQTTLVDHYIVFTNTTASDPGTSQFNIIKLQFPDADDGLWCATAGTDFVVTGTTEDSATALPGTTLTGECEIGSGPSSYDIIYICSTGTGNAWAGATKYGVSLKDGSTGKLGTSTAANDIKVTVSTGTHATLCQEPSATVDTGNYALSILADDQVAVSATVAPLLTFSISDVTIGFGEMTTSDDYWATSDATGATSEPGSGNPTTITISTNATNGALVSARSTGDGTGAEGNGSAGLYKSVATTDLIAAVASSTITTGATEGYGLYVKQVGSNLTADEGFDNDTTSDLAISTTSQTILTASAPISTDNTADVALKAAIAATTLAGSFADTITLIGTGKF